MADEKKTSLQLDEFFEAAASGVLRAIEAQNASARKIVDRRIFIGIWAERALPQELPRGVSATGRR